MSGRGESFSVGNGPGRETFWGGPLYGSNRRPPGQEQKASQPQETYCENRNRNASHHCFPGLGDVFD
jgi:hypothetical protein